jgi:DNA-binding SARP family transcriptional activator
LAVVALRRQRQLAAAGALGTMASLHPGLASTPTGAGDLPAPIWAGGDPTDSATVGIRTIGGLQIWADGEDLAPTLLKKPVAAFMLLRLLIQAILHPDTRMTRDELGEEVFPGISEKSRHGNTRKRLHAIRNFTPALAERLLEDSGVGFDLTGCNVDAIELLDLARSCSGSAVLPPELVPKADQIVALTSDRFLPFWETLDKKVTGGDGASIELVEAIRGQLEIAREDVLAALGATHVASGQAQRAIAVLLEVRRMRPDRQDVANQLVVAYRAAGRDPEAERVLLGTDVEQ